jgi:hypothetical protein
LDIIEDLNINSSIEKKNYDNLLAKNKELNLLNDKYKRDLFEFNEKIKLKDIEILELKSNLLRSNKEKDINNSNNNLNNNTNINININNIKKNSLYKETINSPMKNIINANKQPLNNNNDINELERYQDLAIFNTRRSSSSININNSGKKLSINNSQRKKSNISNSQSYSNEKLFDRKIDKKSKKKTLPRFFIEIGFKLFFEGIKRSNLIFIEEKNMSNEKITDNNYKENILLKNIFGYLDVNSILNYSNTCREKRKSSLILLEKSLKIKKENLSLVYNKINKQYSSILSEKKFELSLSTSSALKILNKPTTMDMINKKPSSFNSPIILMIYQLLLQILKLSNDAIKLDIDQCLDVLKNLIKNKLNTIGFGKNFLLNILSLKLIHYLNLGDYLKQYTQEMKLDDEDIKKIFHILRKYNIENIDLSVVGKLCKNTGMISFFVKDAVNYFGIEKEIDKKLVKRRTRSATMFKLLDNLDKGGMIILKYDFKINSLKSIIDKYDG